MADDRDLKGPAGDDGLAVQAEEDYEEHEDQRRDDEDLYMLARDDDDVRTAFYALRSASC